MNEEQYWVIYIWNLLVKTILNIFIENSILKFPCHPLKNGDWGGGGVGRRVVPATWKKWKKCLLNT